MELNTITQADALEFLKGLPDQSIDAVICDPPYGHNNGQDDLAGARASTQVKGGRQRGAIAPIANDTHADYEALIIPFLTEVDRVLKRNGALTMFCGGGGVQPTFAKVALWVDTYLSFFHAVVWDKSARGYGMGWRYRRNYEFIMIAHKRGGNLKWGLDRDAQPNVVYFPPVPNELHPTQKPIDMMEWLILNHTNTGDIVLDPFAGSGTTAIAARNTGRHFYACDSSAAYVAAANLRLINSDPYRDSILPDGSRQLSLFQDRE